MVVREDDLKECPNGSSEDSSSSCTPGFAMKVENLKGSTGSRLFGNIERQVESR